MLIRIHEDIRPNVVRTFFSKDDALEYLKSEGAYNGPVGWRRPLRDGERRKVTNPITEGCVFYVIEDHRGWSVTLF